MNSQMKMAVAGLLAGSVTGLFGTGGGMILVPLLTMMTDIQEEDIFTTSVSIILPICLVSIVCSVWANGLHLQEAFPYLIGSTVGGFLVGLTGQKIPVKWLHRGLGIMILWGGIRYLC